MDEIELGGSYYEMGQQYGTRLARSGFSPDTVSAEKRQFVGDCERDVREHAPELLEELQGVADAGGWGVDLVAAVPLALGYDAGCSVVAISGEHTADGRPLFGRNYDFYDAFSDFSVLYRTRPTGRFGSIGCSDHWTGRHDGINEAGLAVGVTFVPHRGLQPGIMFPLAVRHVLDTCRSVADAVSFLERVPHARNTNFLIADATGAIAVVEAAPEAVVTTHAADGFAAATNHFQSPSMLTHEHTDERSSDSEARLDHLEQWFASRADHLDGTDLERVLGDPDRGVCARPSPNEEDPVCTLWSWAARLGDPDPYLASGSPDDTSYEPVSL